MFLARLVVALVVAAIPLSLILAASYVANRASPWLRQNVGTWSGWANIILLIAGLIIGVWAFNFLIRWLAAIADRWENKNQQEGSSSPDDPGEEVSRPGWSLSWLWPAIGDWRNHDWQKDRQKGAMATVISFSLLLITFRALEPRSEIFFREPKILLLAGILVWAINVKRWCIIPVFRWTVWAILIMLTFSSWKEITDCAGQFLAHSRTGQGIQAATAAFQPSPAEMAMRVREADKQKQLAERWTIFFYKPEGSKERDRQASAKVYFHDDVIEVSFLGTTSLGGKGTLKGKFSPAEGRYEGAGSQPGWMEGTFYLKPNVDKTNLYGRWQSPNSQEKMYQQGGRLHLIKQ